MPDEAGDDMAQLEADLNRQLQELHEQQQKILEPIKARGIPVLNCHWCKLPGVAVVGHYPPGWKRVDLDRHEFGVFCAKCVSKAQGQAGYIRNLNAQTGMRL